MYSSIYLYVPFLGGSGHQVAGFDSWGESYPNNRSHLSTKTPKAGKLLSPVEQLKPLARMDLPKVSTFKQAPTGYSHQRSGRPGSGSSCSSRIIGGLIRMFDIVL